MAEAPSSGRTLHFTPTSSSWLNLVERWFAEITRQRIRRGTFGSVDALIAAITDIPSTTTTKLRGHFGGRKMRIPFWPKSSVPNLVLNRHARDTSIRRFADWQNVRFPNDWQSTNLRVSNSHFSEAAEPAILPQLAANAPVCGRHRDSQPRPVQIVRGV